VSVSLRDIEGGSMIGEERILDKFSCEGCRRPSVGSESLLVAKTQTLYGNPLGSLREHRQSRRRLVSEDRLEFAHSSGTVPDAGICI
jgi:hypothetical protein